MSDVLVGATASFRVGATNAAVAVHFNKLTPKWQRKLSDTTDSSTFDNTTDLVWNSQVPVSARVEMDAEGWYHTTNSNTETLTTWLLDGDGGAVQVEIRKNDTTKYLSGNFDIENFEVTIETEERTGFKATLKSNGVVDGPGNALA